MGSEMCIRDRYFGGTILTIRANNEQFTDAAIFTAAYLRPIVSYRPDFINHRTILRLGVEYPLMFTSERDILNFRTPFYLMVSLKYLFRWHQDIKLAPEIRFYYCVNNINRDDSPINPYIERITVNRISFAFTIW